MHLVRVLFLILMSIALAACAKSAAQMAATQPEAVDLQDILKRGTPRDTVIARLGAPQLSSRFGLKRAEVYKFRQGFSAGNRTARVFVHSTLSIATLGLWEIAGTAIEGYARGSVVSLRVMYDDQDLIENFEILDGKDAVDGDVLNRSLQNEQLEKKPETTAPSIAFDSTN